MAFHTTAPEQWLDAFLTLPPWLGFGIVVGLSVVAARVIQVWGDIAIRRLTRRIPGQVDDIFFRGIHPPLYVTVVLSGAYLATFPFDLGVEVGATIESVLITVLTVVWATSLIRIGRAVSNEAKRDERLDQQLFPIFQNIWTALLIGGAVFVVLATWDIDVTPLLASAGILGIVLGFAARDSIANFFGSIALYADGTYRVGDYVVLDSGERGVVEDVSIRSTVIRTRDDVLVTIPNSVLNNATVINESEPESQYRITVSLGVAYGTDVEVVEETLQEVATGNDAVLETPRPRVRFRNFGESALEFALLCWVERPVERGRVTHELNHEIYRRFRAEDIEIPFPQRDVRIRSGHDERKSGPAMESG